MPKAISYIRFSASHQGRGSTTERQQEMVAEWLEKNPEVTLSGLSQKDCGKSAFKGEHLNHGLGRILAAISEKKIVEGDYILVEAVDRIGRLKNSEMLQIITKIINDGVTIVTLEDSQEYDVHRINNDQSTIYILIGKIQQAHNFSKQLSDRLLHSYKEKRKKAKKGIKIAKLNPYWLDSNGNLLERKARMVSECVRLYLSGRGTRQIILELKDEYPEITSKHPSTIKRWLSNKALIGEWETNDESIANVYEPLISRADYYKIKKEMRRRKLAMSPEQTYKLSGLVRCEKCGARYYFRRKKHNDETIIYGNCSTYLKRGKEFCGNKTTWPYEVLYSIIHNAIPTVFSANAWKDIVSELTSEIESLKEERKDIEEKIKRLVNLAAELPETAEIAEKIQELGEERKGIDKKITNTESIILDTNESNSDFDSFAEFSEKIDKANELQEKIMSDPITYREALKKSGFRIEGSGNVMRANLNLSDHHFTLLRRTTRHKCYIVQVKEPDQEGIDEEDDTTFIQEGQIYYCAIDRKGEIAWEFDERLLMDSLEAMHGNKSYVDPFDGPLG